MIPRASAIVLLLLSLAGAARAGATYDLTPKPEVARRIAYEASLDQQLTAETSNAANMHTTRSTRFHAQVVVKLDEVTAVKAGSVAAKRITFDRNCWTNTQENNDPPRKIRLVYADKTVNFRLTDDGKIDQDYGVKAGRDQMRLLFDIMEQQTLLPRRAAWVGERWACDDFFRAALDLKKTDVASTIATFKGVRDYAGRQVAEITLSAAAIRADGNGFNEEQSLEGTYLYDLASGVPLKCDVTGKSNLAGRPEDGPAMNVSGTGSFEMHYAARFVAPPPATTEPAAEISSAGPAPTPTATLTPPPAPTTQPAPAAAAPADPVDHIWTRSGTARRR